MTKRGDTNFFWDKVNTDGECWLWTSSTVFGYGIFARGDLRYRAHRYAYEQVIGPIPTGMAVCHHCDNPTCVRPAHLFVGTQKDNVQDMVKKGRVQHGSKHYHAVLTEEIVREARRLYAAGGITQVAIAERLSIPRSSISDILLGKKWKHV